MRVFIGSLACGSLMIRRGSGGGHACQHPEVPFPGSCPIVNRTSHPAHLGRRPS